MTDLLDGINYSRDVEQGGSPADQGFRLDTRWHSYATRVGSAIAEAESKGIDALETRVSSMSLYGSPGIIAELEVNDFPADDVYATKASGDQVADLGKGVSLYFGVQDLTGRTYFVLPEDMQGVEVYNSDGGDGFKRVTQHDRYVEPGSTDIFNWGENYGYDNYGTSSNRATALIMNGLEPELLNETGE